MHVDLSSHISVLLRQPLSIKKSSAGTAHPEIWNQNCSNIATFFVAIILLPPVLCRWDGGIIEARNWMERSGRQRLGPSATSGKAFKNVLKGPKHESFGSKYYTIEAYLSGNLRTEWKTYFVNFDANFWCILGKKTC
jgi:hypothetical protein